tara:strand:+ start:123 stop:1376 length:1254 start_codon:yes stop_codon:yes gene_type:complete
LQLINRFLSNNKIFLYISVFSLSLYQKIRNIEFVEYKYDQYFGDNVIQSCNINLLNFSNLEFLYIRSSSGVPQGPFHFTLECIAGILGVNDYLGYLQIKIIFSQIIIFIIIYLLQDYLSEFEIFTLLLLILFNPYLVVSSRNTSVAYGYEVLLVVFLYLILKVNDSKKNTLIYSTFSIFTLVFYFPTFIFINCTNGVLFLRKYFKNLSHFIYGNVIGLFLVIIAYLPYLLSNPQLKLNDGSKSWGLSSHWRINLHAISGDSLNNKINSSSDIDTLLMLFPNYLNLHKINYFLITFLLVLSLINFFKKFNLVPLDIFDYLFLISMTFTGIFYTLLDIPLYPHYFFFNIFFTIVFIVKNIQPKLLLFIVSCVFFITSNIILQNFHSYIQENNGAQTSDYGKSYNTCGCCTDEISRCKGQ